MPNVRAPGQKLITIPVDEDFIAAVDRGLTKLGYRDRSSFVREAIVEKLQAGGIIVPAHLAAPPSRLGKGGPRAGHGTQSDQVKPKTKWVTAKGGLVREELADLQGVPKHLGEKLKASIADAERAAGIKPRKH